jgi:hypothetical protein
MCPPLATHQEHQPYRRRQAANPNSQNFSFSVSDNFKELEIMLVKKKAMHSYKRYRLNISLYYMQGSSSWMFPLFTDHLVSNPLKRHLY